MTEKYDKVPNIISTKDLDYLSDMFNWNYIAYKLCLNFGQIIDDASLKEVVDKSANTFHNAMTKVLSILQKGGQDGQ